MTTDWSKTVLVPKSPLPMKAELARREPETLARWDREGLYGRIRDARRGRPSWLLHDGPPYANGEIHMGHALNKSLKDFLVRFHTMRGEDAPYVPGWDCHGLPIEREAVKKLDPEKKRNRVIVRKACRAYAEKFIEKQKAGFIRLGIFGEWDRPYLTMAPSYQASILEAFRRVWDEGLVYRAQKPIHWCASCETALAEAEVEYGPHTSPQVTVAFAYGDGTARSALIWTTTPWTLPANLAVAVHPDLEYVEVRPAGSSRTFLVADALLLGVASDAGWKNLETLARHKGRSLEGMSLRHPFLDREVKIILADFVTIETGTGLVHIAPGHGADDYVVGRKYGLEVLSPVDARGRFTLEAGVASLVGKKVWEANPEVIEILRDRGALLATGSLDHSYPHCWRCREPILFRATPQWFLKIDPLRAAASAAIPRVRWIPAWGEERFAKTVAARPDWCLSRQRAWGVPIPAARCRGEGCGEVFLDGGIFDRLLLSTRADRPGSVGADIWFERPEEILAGAKCPKCGCTELAPETDILDVWFDSGVSWYAVGKDRPDLRFPADLYLEGSDQHRGWFQTSFWPALALTGAPPYQSVLTHGFLLDGAGRAMSKSIGNVIAPEEITKEFGADVLRLWVASQNFREDLRLSREILLQVAESYKKIRNTWRFLLGNLVGFERADADFDPARHEVARAGLDPLDRWILAKLGGFLSEAEAAYAEADFTRLVHATMEFFIRDLSGIYLDCAKDRLYCDAPDAPSRRSAQTASWHVLTSTVRLLAPILVFTSEEVWGLLPGVRDSVHLAEFSSPDSFRDEAAEKAWAPLLAAAARIQPELERAKNEKRIAKPAEARVRFADAALAGRESDLALLARVAQVDLAPEGEIAITRTDLPKCPRCWRHTPLSGEVCARCTEVGK